MLGAVAAKLVFRELSLWEAGILGAILAPTDAGLGQVIVNSPRVPARIRQALNVEAGLNDGLSVPFLLFFIALAAANVVGGAASLAEFIGQQLGFGLLVGAAIGLAGGWLLGRAHSAIGWRSPFARSAWWLCRCSVWWCRRWWAQACSSRRLSPGLTVQVGFKDAGKHSVEFAEEWGQLFNLSVFFLVRGAGAARLAARIRVGIRWCTGCSSLTVVRMVPVAIALTGTRLSPATVLFMGWFGPRGLASIVLGLVYLEQGLYLPRENM